MNRKNILFLCSVLFVSIIVLACDGDDREAKRKNPPPPPQTTQSPLEREITFVNKCTEDIWLSAAGNTGACVPSTGALCQQVPSCVSSNECPTNEYCASKANSPKTDPIVNGACATQGGGNDCSTDNDCPPMQNCSNGKCQPACTDDSDCQGANQFCVNISGKDDEGTCWTEKPQYCNRTINDANKGGCPDNINLIGEEVPGPIRCSANNPCPADPDNPPKQRTCNPSTGTCYTVGDVGCYCEKDLPTPACAWRQCRYVPVKPTAGQVGTAACPTGNQDCGIEVSPKKGCGNSGNNCEDNQYCRQVLNDKSCYWVGGEVTTPATIVCSQSEPCPEPLQYCNPTTNTCWAEQYCNSFDSTCYFVPTDGNGWIQMAATTTPTKEVVKIPVPWAGRFWARTGCPAATADKFECDTGSCLGMEAKFQKYCENPGVPPVTAAEFAIGLNGNTIDFYDVSMTDSANLAVSIVPANYDMNMNGGIGEACDSDSDCDTSQANRRDEKVEPEKSCSMDSDCGPEPYQYCHPSEDICYRSLNNDTFNFKCDTTIPSTKAGTCVNTYHCGSPGCVDMDGCAAEGITKSFIDCCPWDRSDCSTGLSAGFAVSESSCTASIFADPPGTINVNSLKWRCDPSTFGSCGNAKKVDPEKDCPCTPPEYCNTITNKCWELAPGTYKYRGCLGALAACDLGNNPTDLNCTGAPKCDTDADCVATPGVPTPVCTGGICVSSNTMQMKELYGCTGANHESCYTKATQYPPIDGRYFCCGCSEWSPINNNFDLSNPDGKSTCAEIPRATPYEHFTNVEWVNNAEPIPKIFHDACPQAYSFAYDDKVATFTCNTTKDESDVDYTITFCPQLP